MSSHEDRRPGRRLAGLARRLGFDRNPLRRGTDRIEAALRLVVMIMLVTAVPAAAAGAAGLVRARTPGPGPEAAERLGCRVAGERPALERPLPLRPLRRDESRAVLCRLALPFPDLAVMRWR